MPSRPSICHDEICFYLEALIRQSLHQYDDIHIVFEPHDEGMNWRRYHLNRNAWLLLVGFHQDLRNFTEIAISIKSFGKLIIRDREKSTRAAIW